MITSIIIDGVAKVLQFRRDSNKKNQVCRIFPLDSAIPEMVLDEVQPGSNLFADPSERVVVFRAGEMAELIAM